MCIGGYNSMYLRRVLFICNYFLFFCSSHIYEMSTGDTKMKEVAPVFE